eukprot:c16799_g2_i2.p1 GENE.c16799_g2_i2~~c16799_g2_i2.p1  ORF type:complete len:680 (+),score=182.14 c16799_g2_i2:237-2042(+)
MIAAGRGAMDATKGKVEGAIERFGGAEAIKQKAVQAMSGVRARAAQLIEDSSEIQEMGKLAQKVFSNVKASAALTRLRDKETRAKSDLQSVVAESIHQGSVMLSKAAAIHTIVESHLVHLRREIRRAVLSEVSATFVQVNRIVAPEASSDDSDPIASLVNFVAPVQLQLLHAQTKFVVYTSPIIIVICALCLALDWNKPCDLDYKDFFLALAGVEMFSLAVNVWIFAQTLRFQVRYERELSVVVKPEDNPDYPRPEDYDDGRLVLIVERATSCPAMDFGLLSGGSADPYVTITIDKSVRSTDIREISQDSTSWRTKVQHKTLNPVWGEAIDLGPDVLANDQLVFKLFDRDKTSTDDIIGECKVNVKELTQYNKSRFRLTRGDKPVVGMNKKDCELHIVVLKLPNGYPPPKKRNERMDGFGIRYDDLLEMGEEALRVSKYIKSSPPYWLMRLTTPFFVGWRGYGVYLMYDGICQECSATALQKLNLVLALIYIIFFLLNLTRLVFWVAEVAFRTFGADFLLGKAEDLDRQHVGFPIFTLLANQVVKHKKTNLHVYVRAKRQRELDVMVRRRQFLQQQVIDLNKQIGLLEKQRSGDESEEKEQ